MRMRAQMLRAVVTLVAQKGGNVLSYHGNVYGCRPSD